MLGLGLSHCTDIGVIGSMAKYRYQNIKPITVTSPRATVTSPLGNFGMRVRRCGLPEHATRVRLF